MRALMGTAMVVLIAGSAFAQSASDQAISAETFKTVNVGNLLKLCSASDRDPMAKEATEFCLGMVVGAYGVYDELVRGGKATPIVCPPPGVTRVDGAKAFVDWAQANPGAHSSSAVDGLFRAWTASYPCPRAQRR